MSDYFDCKSPGCKNPESYVCDHGTWILKTSVNNGVEDCADGSDEGTIGNINTYSNQGPVPFFYSGPLEYFLMLKQKVIEIHIHYWTLKDKC